MENLLPTLTTPSAACAKLAHTKPAPLCVARKKIPMPGAEAVLYHFQSTAQLGSSFCARGQSGPASVLPMPGISLRYGARKSPTRLGKGAQTKSIYFTFFRMSSRELGSAQRSSMRKGGIKELSTALCRILSATVPAVGWGGGRWQLATSGIKLWGRRIGNNHFPVVRVHLLQEDI